MIDHRQEPRSFLELESKGKHKIWREGKHNPTILYNLTRSYIRSYLFYDPSAILNVLVRWDRKIVRSYNSDRDFDNHATINNSLVSIKEFLSGWRVFC